MNLLLSEVREKILLKLEASQRRLSHIRGGGGGGGGRGGGKSNSNNNNNNKPHLNNTTNSTTHTTPTATNSNNNTNNNKINSKIDINTAIKQELVYKLFSEIEVYGDGTIDKVEFRYLLSMLQLQYRYVSYYSYICIHRILALSVLFSHFIHKSVVYIM